MFWKKKYIKQANKSADEISDNHYPHAKRNCWLYISDKYKEVLFVPMGNVDPWMSREINKVLIKPWPLNIGELQDGIEQTLNNFEESVPENKNSNESWYSYRNSKAKTQRSFKVDYVQILLETDLERSYGPQEVERITVKASPKDWNEDGYKIIGNSHLLETQVAQKVLDIYSACERIRN